MKTVILAGLDNLVFSAADLLNPKEYKLIGFGTPIEQAWNVYDANGEIKEDIQEMPVMPVEAAVAWEPDRFILAAGSREEDEALRYILLRANYQGEVFSLYDFFNGFSFRTAALRKLAWRLESLGVQGALADLGCYRGDISWQLNALMPDRKLYLFDTFTGYDARDIAKERELGLSEARPGEWSFSSRELENFEQRILSRMPHEENVVVRAGWFPETALELEDEHYALVYMDAGLYQPTVAGIQDFYPRMEKGGVILIAGYEDGRTLSVRKAVADLEAQYGAFLMLPLCDLSGTVMIVKP